MMLLTSFRLSAAIAILLPFSAAQHNSASENSDSGKGGKTKNPHNGAAAQSSTDNPLPALLSSIAGLDPAATVVVGGSPVTVSAASFIATAQGFLSTVNTASALSAAASIIGSSASDKPTTTPITSSTTRVPVTTSTSSIAAAVPPSTTTPIPTTLSTQHGSNPTSSSATAATAAALTASVPAPSSSSNHLTIGLGAGLGIPLAAVLLAGLIFFLHRKRRQRASRACAPEPVVVQRSEKEIAPPRHGFSELGNDGEIVEASSVPDPVELSTVPYKGWVGPRHGAVEIG